MIDLDSTTADRLQIPIPIEVIDDLIDWWSDNPPPFHWIEIGWDLRRHFGADGQDAFRIAAWSLDPPEHDGDKCLDDLWASFHRAGPTQYDRLLFDEMSFARRDGWQPPAEFESMFADLDQQADELQAAERRLRNFRIEMMAETLEANMTAPSLYVVPQTAPLPDLIKTSAEFVHGFVPPAYLLDGVLQRRFCYSMTAQTGVGKTTVAMLLSALVSIGRPLGALDVEKGSVLYFAGENPTDIQMRWLGLTQELGIDPATADVHFIPGAMPLSQVADRITSEVARKGLQPALVVVDTAAAYFEGEDENSNTQAVAHAKRMRSLTELPGGPSVLILCHPTKRASDDDLIPRGGGAFLAEVDGNIALQKHDTLIVASALGKFRGPEFTPLRFELRKVYHPILKDARGRDIPTVVARAVDEAGAVNIERSGRQDEDALLRAVDKAPGANPTDLARMLGWTLRAVAGKPAAVHHVKAKRMLERLQREKLVDCRRSGWHLTTKGQHDLNEADRRVSANAAPSIIPTMPLPRGNAPFEQPVK